VTIVIDMVTRGLRLYFRDRLRVFFSLLSALILFLLYMLFLRSLQTSSLTSILPHADSADISTFIDTWMFAGIIGMTTITTGLGAFGPFVDDAATGRFRDFLVSPIRRSQLVLGYLLTSFLVATAMSMVVLGVSVAYLFFVDGLLLSIGQLAVIVGEVALSCLGFAALSAFLISFIRSQGAFAALSSIVGAALGFFAGAYVPIGLFPIAVQNFINAMPFGEAATVIRQQLSEGPLATLTGGQAQSTAHLENFYGITASVGEWQITVGYVAAILIAMAVIFTALAAARIRSRLR
jgi:multidrug/hemolysin transport system permease protein